MGCCSKNNRNSENINIVKYDNETQDKKKTPWLIGIVLLIVFMLLIFSALH